MSRKRPNFDRVVQPDAKYNDILVAQCVNYIMQDGEKAIAQRIFYRAMDIIAEEMNTKEPLSIFKQAVKNATPLVEVRSKRLGGANYQVPVEVRQQRGTSLALRWILQTARNQQGKPMERKFANELMDAYNKTGAVIKKRENVHKMAEANKAFAHLG
ncbi:MAG: 30S ribosomal protein S7 [Parcubacteria group bacterium SW_4_49_11]|jgi:small subunit ribosomal protein S7|nr:MAG: 30S ribosomal protein S7 [Parcubacteria group bacterium SW_4_49_11]